MAITLEAIRAAGGIVRSDGNIFFRDISMLQGLAGAAPAAVAPQDVVAWMHPETLNVISAAHKHDMSTEYGAETRRKAESHSVALVRAGEPAVAAPALEAPPAVAPQGEYPHEQMDAMALARYKVVPSHASMLWSHAVVAGDGAQQLYVGREVECQNMARKFAGAFLDGAFAFHSMAAAPTAQAAPALEAPAAPAVPLKATPEMRAAFRSAFREGGFWDDRLDYALDQMLAAAPQAPAAPAVDASDKALLDFLRDTSCDLRSIDVPTGGDDSDVHWRVIEHYMSEPREREIGRSWSDDPREAIRAAIAAQAKEGGAQ